MAAGRTCRQCGTSVSKDAPYGHCPKCLFELGFLDVPPEELKPKRAGSPLRIGDYELLEQIGRGGMGVVYKARQVSLNRVVAVKMVLDSHLASPVVLRRLMIEAEAVAKLDHPNIISIYEFGDVEGHYFFSMQLIEGDNLERRIALGQYEIARKTRLSGRDKVQEKIAQLMAAVARAVDYAHSRGVLHRDLKPSNILIDGEGRPHITDFGLAKILDGTSGPTAPTGIVGTPAYMAPEQAQGTSVTAATDIYSMGVILYELLTGHLPFAGTSPLDVLRRSASEEPVSPKHRNPSLDTELATICLKCLDKDPLRRYSTAGELAADVERWLKREPISARPPSIWLRTRRWTQRYPAAASALAILAVSAVTASLLLVKVSAEKRQREAANARLKYSHDLLRDDLEDALAQLWDSTAEDAYLSISSERMAIWIGEDIPAASAAPERRLKFGVYSQETPAAMLEIMAPILKKLEKAVTPSLGPTRIDMRIFKRDEKAREAVDSDEIGFMAGGAASYLFVKSLNPRVQLICAQNGKPVGAFIVPVMSPITNVAQLEGARIAYVDANSTLGNIVPKKRLTELGFRAADFPDFGTNYTAQAHDVMANLVASRKVDAGAGNLSVILKTVSSNEVRVLECYEETVGRPWVAAPNLPPEIVAALRAGLHSIARAHTNTSLLNALGNKSTGFIDVSDSDFDSLRQAIQAAECFHAPRNRSLAQPAK